MFAPVNYFLHQELCFFVQARKRVAQCTFKVRKCKPEINICFCKVGELTLYNSVTLFQQEELIFQIQRLAPKVPQFVRLLCPPCLLPAGKLFLLCTQVVCKENPTLNSGKHVTLEINHKQEINGYTHLLFIVLNYFLLSVWLF